MLTISEAREQWSPARVYLNTASFGLPPRASVNALQAISTTPRPTSTRRST